MTAQTRSTEEHNRNPLALSAMTSALESTRNALRYTRGHDLSKPAGALTLAQAAELMDALGNVRAVCCHVFAHAGRELPDRYRERLDTLGLRLSIAQARDVLKLWKRWTHPLDTASTPLDSIGAVSLVEGFIWSLGDKAWTQARKVAA